MSQKESLLDNLFHVGRCEQHGGLAACAAAAVVSMSYWTATVCCITLLPIYRAIIAEPSCASPMPMSDVVKNREGYPPNWPTHFRKHFFPVVQAAVMRSERVMLGLACCLCHLAAEGHCFVML